jgi:hypothetical protein
VQGPLIADPRQARARLAGAPLVFCAGGGVGDLAALLRAASAFDAALGGSAALCDDVRLPRAVLVGVSGTLLHARCYVGFGVHGAPHHLAALDDVAFVISVNADPWAPLHDRADIAIVADPDATLRALAECVQRTPKTGREASSARPAPAAPLPAAPAPSPAGVAPAERLERLLLPPRGRRERLSVHDPSAAAAAIARLLRSEGARP